MSNLQRTDQEAATPDQLSAIDSLKQQAEEFKQIRTPEPVTVPDVDLDAELDAMLAEVEEAEAAETPTQVPLDEQLKQDVLALLKDRDDAPTADQIQAWKDKHGQEAVQVLGLDKDNVYIYTHLTLPQWEKINELVAKLQGTPMADEINSRIREKVIRAAVLWPRLEPDFFQTCRAGLPDTIYQLILIHSYFLSPQQAMTLTTQL